MNSLSVQIVNAASHLRVTCSWGPRFMVTPMLNPAARPETPLGKMSILTECCGAVHVRTEKDMPGLHCGLCHRGQVERRTAFPVGSDEFYSWIEDQFEPLLAEVVSANLLEALRRPYHAVLEGPNARFQQDWLIYTEPSS